MVVGGGRMGQRSQGCEVGGGEEALAMDSGNTGSPQTKFSFLSPPDMAASDGKLTTVNWPY